MKRAQVMGVGVAFIVFLAACAAHAETPPASSGGPDNTDQLLVRYNLYPAFEKLGRGVANILTGWLEIPLTIQKRYVPMDAATSLIGGTIIGLVKGVVRTGVGVYEAVTFPLPYPEHYEPILPTLEYFQKGEKRREPLLLE